MKTIELVCLGRLKKRETNLVCKKNALQKKKVFFYVLSKIKMFLFQIFNCSFMCEKFTPNSSQNMP